MVGNLITIALTQIFGWLGDKQEIGAMTYLLCGTLGIEGLLLIGVPVVKKRSLCNSDGVISTLEEES